MFQDLKKRKDRNVGKNWKIACGQRRLAKVIGKKKEEEEEYLPTKRDREGPAASKSLNLRKKIVSRRPVLHLVVSNRRAGLQKQQSRQEQILSIFGTMKLLPVSSSFRI